MTGLIKTFDWSALYNDFSLYKSDKYEWKDLPYIGVQRITINYSGEKYKTHFSGWDVYWLEIRGNDLHIGAWKDDDPADPYYDTGFEHVFRSNGKVTRTTYLDKRVWSKIPYKARKRGLYLDEKTAKKMGILS